MTAGRNLPGWIARIFGISCAVVWIAAFVATHVPIDRLPQPAMSDKVLHFVCYFLIASLFLLTLAGLRLTPAKRNLTVLCVVILYGAFDEITQMYVGRTASVGDWIADSLGAATAVLVVGAVLFLLARRHAGGSHAR